MTEIVRYQSTPPESVIELAPKIWQLVQKIVNTEAVPKALRGRPESVLAVILTGHEAGISPMQAINKIHVVDGRVAMSGELMRALVFKAGHEIWVDELTVTRCTMKGQRAGSTRVSSITWTMDDAQKAGLASKDPWKKYPRAMLEARATAELCRLVFPDVLAGISYVPDEIDSVEMLPPGSPESAQAAAPTRQRARATHKATATPSAPETDDPPPPPLDDDIVDAVIVDADPPDISIAAEFRRLVAEPEHELDPEPELPPEPEIVDAELVDEPATYDDPPSADTTDNGPRLTAGQLVAIRFGEAGIHDRTERLAITSAIIGRKISSSNELDPDDVRTVLDAIAAGNLPAVASGSDTAPPPDEPPVEGKAVDRARRAPVPPAPAAVRLPDEWSGDEWRTFIGARKAKVVAVMKEANRLGALAGKSIPTLDEIAGSGIGPDLVGFIEELTLQR